MPDIIGYGAGNDEMGADIIGAFDDLTGYDETGDDDASGYDDTGADDMAALIQAATSGYDDTGADIIGALRRMAGRGRAPMARRGGGRAMARGRGPAPMAPMAQGLGRKVMLKPDAYTKVREYPLGFDSGIAIAAGNTLAITTRPQVPFRGDRLVIPSDIAGIFVLADIKVGKNSQFAASGNVSGRTFQENAVSVRLGLDTAPVAMDITLLVVNISGAPARFFATLIGTALE